MNFTESIELDEELSQQMNEIDWWNLSETETQNLGLSIGMLTEAQADVRQSDDAYRRCHYLNWGIGFICLTGLFLKLPLAALIVGITVALFINTIISKISLNISTSMVKSHRTALLDEIKCLSEEHPVGPSGDEEDATDTDE
jgi:hypothetical protein